LYSSSYARRLRWLLRLALLSVLWCVSCPVPCHCLRLPSGLHVLLSLCLGVGGSTVRYGRRCGLSVLVGWLVVVPLSVYGPLCISVCCCCWAVVLSTASSLVIAQWFCVFSASVMLWLYVPLGATVLCSYATVYLLTCICSMLVYLYVILLSYAHGQLGLLVRCVMASLLLIISSPGALLAALLVLVVLCVFLSFSVATLSISGFT